MTNPVALSSRSFAVVASYAGSEKSRRDDDSSSSLSSSRHRLCLAPSDAIAPVLVAVDAESNAAPSATARYHATSPSTSSAARSRSLHGTRISTPSSTNGIDRIISSRPRSPRARVLAPANARDVHPRASPSRAYPTVAAHAPVTTSAAHTTADVLTPVVPIDRAPRTASRDAVIDDRSTRRRALNTQNHSNPPRFSPRGTTAIRAVPR
mmetsp:Transcript_8707/g.32436  ORF Transcript_8707/g.32436 Transcript_8707/m.32436 type:complete len:209 (-) Transcript_8707:41-667(-)